MRFGLPLLACSIFALSLLSACNSVQSELILSPVQIGTKTMVRADRAGACFGLDRSVIAPSRLVTTDGQVGAGYENSLIRGAEPTPCNVRRNYSHQGAVLFDFSELTRRHAAVLEATLEADAAIPVFPEGIVINMQINRATEAWAGGNFVGPVNVPDPRAQIAMVLLVSGEGAAADGWTSNHLRATVTRTVQNWFQSRPLVANHGFVFAPLPAHVFAEENQNLIATFGNIRLRLKILAPATP